MKKIIKISLVVAVLTAIILSIYNKSMSGFVSASGLCLIYASLFIWKR